MVLARLTTENLNTKRVCKSWSEGEWITSFFERYCHGFKLLLLNLLQVTLKVRRYTFIHLGGERHCESWVSFPELRPNWSTLPELIPVSIAWSGLGVYCFYSRFSDRMYFAIFLCGAGHLKHLKIRSPSQENQEQTCGAHGKLMSTNKLFSLPVYIQWNPVWDTYGPKKTGRIRNNGVAVIRDWTGT